MYGIKVVNLSSNTRLSQDGFKDLLGNPQISRVLILGGEFLFPGEIESQIKELGYNVVRIGGNPSNPITIDWRGSRVIAPNRSHIVYYDTWLG